MHTTQPHEWFEHSDVRGLPSDEGDDQHYAEKAPQYRGRGTYTDHNVHADGLAHEGEDAPGIIAQAYAELERPQSRRGDPTGDLLADVDYDRYVYACRCVCVCVYIYIYIYIYIHACRCVPHG